MYRLVRQLWFQIGVAVLAGWGAFYLGEWYETAEMMRTSPHDGMAGMSVLAAGAVGSVVGFFGVFLLMLGLERLLKKPSED